MEDEPYHPDITLVFPPLSGPKFKLCTDLSAAKYRVRTLKLDRKPLNTGT